MNKTLDELQKKIDYIFKNTDILKQALIHPSYSAEMNMDRLNSNQRLEFLGDAVLELVVSEYLYKSHPKDEEGDLTRIRASLVFERALNECAVNIALGNYIYLGKGEEKQGGRLKPSILSDTFEALIGAIYIDGGIEKAGEFIHKFLLNNVDELTLLSDGKSFLQEYVQKKQGRELFYNTKEDSTDISQKFKSEVYIDKMLIAAGTGRSKKTAEQAAANNAIKKLGIGK